MLFKLKMKAFTLESRIFCIFLLKENQLKKKCSIVSTFQMEKNFFFKIREENIKCGKDIVLVVS